MTKNFFKGAAMFALLGIVGKIIGMFYRLPLTNILGAEGMGIYQMIFPVYSFILAVLCGGIPAAISKNVSELTALNDEMGAKRTLRVALVAVTAIGIVIGIIVFIFKNKLAEFQGNDKATSAYIAIVPAIVFSGMIACFRGYFQGRQNLLPGGISQIAEQTIKLAAGLLFAAVLVKKGVEYGVFGALLGVSISEAVALAYLIVRYLYGSSERKTLKKEVRLVAPSVNVLQTEVASDTATVSVSKRESGKDSYRKIIKNVYSIAIPITLGALVLPISQLTDSFLIVNLLTERGESVETATALFGIMSGPVGSLLNMPSVITIALATALLPKIAHIKSKGLDMGEAINKSVSFFMATILPCVALFLIAPEAILGILYSRGLSDDELRVAAMLLRIESVDLFTLGIIQLTSALLQGMGKAKIPVLNLVIGAVIKIATTITLVPVLGIVGAAIGNVAFYGVTCSLDMLYAKKYCGELLNYKKQAKILLCALCFAIIMSGYTALSLFVNDVFAFIGVFIIAAAAYVALLLKTKCILLREILF